MHFRCQVPLTIDHVGALSPRHGDPKRRRAHLEHPLRHRRGRRNEAVESYQRAITVDANNAQAKSGLSRLGGGVRS